MGHNRLSVNCNKVVKNHDNQVLVDRNYYKVMDNNRKSIHKRIECRLMILAVVTNNYMRIAMPLAARYALASPIRKVPK